MHLPSDAQNVTRELEELRGQRVKDVGFGGAYIVILTEGR